MTDEEKAEQKVIFDSCLNFGNEILSEMRRENREMKQRIVTLESQMTALSIVTNQEEVAS